MLSEMDRPLFVIGFVLLPSPSEARIPVFHREGAYITDMIELKKKNEVRQFVRRINGSKNYAVVLPDGSYWRAHQLLTSRNWVLGRATRFHVIEPYVIPPDPLTTSPPAAVAPTAPKQEARTTRLQTRPQQPGQVASAGFAENQGDASSEDEGKNSDDINPKVPNFRKHLIVLAHEFPRLQPQPTAPLLGEHEKLVLKDLCPLKVCNYEGEVFESAKRCFGVPDVVTTYAIHDENERQTTSRFLPIYEVKQWGGEKKISKDATIHSDDPSPSPPNQERIRMRFVIITVGKPLTEAASLYELLKTILHVIIGHHNLFKKGWLHRDVSFGNVMICDATEKPAVISLGEKVKTATEETCVGFISDVDHATPVEPKDDANNANRSGTLPFLSLRLLTLWSDNLTRDINENIHTAVDDLESFMWLIVWVVLHRTKKAGESNKADGLRSREVNWLKMLTIWDYAADFKAAINNRIRTGWAEDFSLEMALALPLLKTLVALSEEGSGKIRGEIRENTITVERHMELAEEYYRKYAEAIIDFLPKLKQ